MPRCRSYSDSLERCENEAVVDSDYCLDHAFKQSNLQAQIEDLRRYQETSLNSLSTKKDIWDKMSSLSGLISGVVIASIGLVATNAYNTKESQAKLIAQSTEMQIRRVDITHKYFTYLSKGTELEKKGALLAIATLGDEQLVVSLAENFGGKGITDALSVLTASSNPKMSERAQKLLGIWGLYEANRKSVVQIEAFEKGATDPIRTKGTGVIVSENGHIVTAGHMFDFRGVREFEIKVTMDGGGTAIPAKLVFSDVESTDVALIKIESPEPLRYVTYPKSRFMLAENTPVIFFSRRGDSIQPVVSKGVISSGAQNERGFIEGQFDSPQSSTSGAPIFNLFGELIGILVAGTRKEDGSPATLILKSERFRDRVDNHR